MQRKSSMIAVWTKNNDGDPEIPASAKFIVTGKYYMWRICSVKVNQQRINWKLDPAQKLKALVCIKQQQQMQEQMQQQQQDDGTASCSDDGDDDIKLEIDVEATQKLIKWRQSGTAAAQEFNAMMAKFVNDKNGEPVQALQSQSAASSQEPSQFTDEAGVVQGTTSGRYERIPPGEDALSQMFSELEAIRRDRLA